MAIQWRLFKDGGFPSSGVVLVSDGDSVAVADASTHEIYPGEVSFVYAPSLKYLPTHWAPANIPEPCEDREKVEMVFPLLATE